MNRMIDDQVKVVDGVRIRVQPDSRFPAFAVFDELAGLLDRARDARASRDDAECARRLRHLAARAELASLDPIGP